MTDCSCSEGSSGALFVNSTNQQFIIKFVNRSEFDVLHSILKDLTTYITMKQMEMFDVDSSVEPNLASEVGQHRLSESDMQETETEVTPSLHVPPEAPSSTQPLHFFYDDEIPLSSEGYSMHCHSPSVTSGLAQFQNSPQPSSQPSPREPVQRSVSAQGMWSQRGRSQLRNTSYCEESISRSTSVTEDARPSREGSVVGSGSVLALRRVTSHHERRQSSLADTEEDSQHHVLKEESCLNHSEKSMNSVHSSDNPTLPLLYTSSNASPFVPTCDHISQTPKSTSDAVLSSSSHPTPRVFSSTHHQPSLAGVSTTREIPFTKEVVGSFLNRYYGMYSIEMFGQKLYFVVMDNLLPRGTVNEVYDLKVGVVVGCEL